MEQTRNSQRNCWLFRCHTLHHLFYASVSSGYVPHFPLLASRQASPDASGQDTATRQSQCSQERNSPPNSPCLLPCFASRTNLLSAIWPFPARKQAAEKSINHPKKTGMHPTAHAHSAISGHPKTGMPL